MFAMTKLRQSGTLLPRVTTHWRHAQDLAKRFPELRVDPNALYLKDGKFYTCAEVTSGIDLSLAFQILPSAHDAISFGGAKNVYGNWWALFRSAFQMPGEKHRRS
jgi:hypothetical protein